MADRMLGQMESRAETKAGSEFVALAVLAMLAAMAVSSFLVRLAALLLMAASD